MTQSALWALLTQSALAVPLARFALLALPARPALLPSLIRSALLALPARFAAHQENTCSPSRMVSKANPRIPNQSRMTEGSFWVQEAPLAWSALLALPIRLAANQQNTCSPMRTVWEASPRIPNQPPTTQSQHPAWPRHKLPEAATGLIDGNKTSYCMICDLYPNNIL